MFKLIILLLFTIISKVICQEKITYNGYKGVTVFGNRDGLETFRKVFEDFDGVMFLEGNYEEHNYLVSPNYLNEFKSAVRTNNLKLKVVYEDLSKIIELETKSRLTKEAFSWDAYYDYDDIYNFLNATALSNPNSTKLIYGGKSYEGRPILGIRIMTPYEEDMEKPAIMIESGIHAREWITPATTTYLINELLTSSNPDLIRLRQKFDWHIFPTVNPDGYHYTHKYDRFWRKTRSPSGNGCYGADPNRNWDHNWNEYGTSDNPCNYQVNAGKKAFSEVETRSLSEYITDIRNLMVYVGLHADAQMLLVPYSDSVEHHDNYDDLIQIGQTSLDYGKKVNGAQYKGPATAAEILYKASGGSMDWVREALATPIIYTYELRGTYFHWPPERIPEQGDELTQMMLGLIVEAENLKYF